MEVYLDNSATTRCFDEVAQLMMKISCKQAQVQGSVATRMDGRAGVLESEIKLDQARGGNTQKKEEELAEVEQKAQAATSSQLSTLAEANKTMEEAAEAESREEKTDSKEEKTDDKDAKTTGEKSDLSVSSSTAAENTASQPTALQSVDIRL